MSRRVFDAIAADHRLRKIAKLSENWPDPDEKRAAYPLKPIHIPNPETQRFIDEAREIKKSTA